MEEGRDQQDRFPLLSGATSDGASRFSGIPLSDCAKSLVKIEQAVSPIAAGRKGPRVSKSGVAHGGQLVGDLVAFIFFILLSRQFGPEGVGIYAFGVVVATVGPYHRKLRRR